MAWRCRFLAARPSQDGDDEHPTHWLISTQVLPFEDTHACLLQSLKDYLDTHAEDEFESKIMLKIGGHRVDSNSADYFRMMPDGVCARRPTFLRRATASATLPYAIDAMRRSSQRR